jgi:hypothetical protein
LRPQCCYLKQRITLFVVSSFIGPAKALLGVALAVVYRRHIGPRDVIVAPPGRYLYAEQLGARGLECEIVMTAEANEVPSLLNIQQTTSRDASGGPFIGVYVPLRHPLWIGKLPLGPHDPREQRTRESRRPSHRQRG